MIQKPAMSRRWIVWGGLTGWIGKKIVPLLADDFVHVTQVRLEDKRAIEDVLDAIKPTHVINCAGVTGRPTVDWCETHRPETVRANVAGVLILADACAARGVHLTNFATGCIYEYDKSTGHGVHETPFTEEDEPNFTRSFYSASKAVAEKMLHAAWPASVLTLRIRMPIDDHPGPRNFVTKIASYARVVNIPNSVTVLHDMLPHAITLATQRVVGIVNFVNPGTLSHNEVLEMYKRHVNPSFVWENFSVEEQNKVLVAPRSNNELCTAKLARLLHPTILTPAAQAAENAIKNFVTA